MPDASSKCRAKRVRFGDGSGSSPRGPRAAPELDAGDLRLAWRADGGVAAAASSSPISSFRSSSVPRLYAGVRERAVRRARCIATLTGPRRMRTVAGASDRGRRRPARRVRSVGGDLRRHDRRSSGGRGAGGVRLWRQQSAQPAPENAAGVDPMAVLLARLRTPGQQQRGGAAPPRRRFPTGRPLSGRTITRTSITAFVTSLPPAASVV